MCDRMFPEESDVVEKYVSGLPDMIHGSVKASKPKTMQEAIEFATELMDKKILTITEPYTAGPGEKKPYGGIKPLCPKCNYYHDGPCAPKCTNYKRIGHLACDCKSRLATANNNQRAQGTNQRVLACYECGAQGHFKSDCPKLKNGNQGNRAGNGNAVARAYALGTARMLGIIINRLKSGSYRVKSGRHKFMWLKRKVKERTILPYGHSNGNLRRFHVRTMQKKFRKQIRTRFSSDGLEKGYEDSNINFTVGSHEREVPAGFVDEVIYSLFAKQSEDLDLLHEDLEQIDDMDIEEIDLNWLIAMIAI
ncbi:putative reverse transcriptase domain-containing protein [Tanacetum coccineum]